MKRTLTSFLIICLMLVTSCNRVDATNDSGGTLNTQGGPARNTGTIATSDSTVGTSYSIEYDLETGVLGFSFDDVYCMCEELLQDDLDALVQSNPDEPTYRKTTDEYDVIYIPDYSVYLDYMTEPDELGYVNYFPEEYEFHITRGIRINGVFVEEFEDGYWAEVCYCRDVDYVLENNTVMTESDYLNGSLFSYDDQTTERFYANYISERCTFNYSCSLIHSDNEDYIIYLNLCERLNIPTCSEMTDEIMN